MFLPTISPHDPKVVFVACDMTGSYLTSDGGASWRMFNLRGRTTVFAFDPVTPGTLYAYGTGLYRSTDGGLRWQLLYPAPRNVRFVAVTGDHADETLRVADGPQEGITALAVDPADSRTLYAAMGSRGESTLRISSDWGESWQSAGALSDGARAIYIDAASPRTGRTIYVAGNTSVAVRAASNWKAGAPAPGGAFVSASGGFSAPGPAEPKPTPDHLRGHQSRTGHFHRRRRFLALAPAGFANTVGSDLAPSLRDGIRLLQRPEEGRQGVLRRRGHARRRPDVGVSVAGS
jgi:hypothetical protein